jgi:hypothetical protein
MFVCVLYGVHQSQQTMDRESALLLSTAVARGQCGVLTLMTATKLKRHFFTNILRMSYRGRRPMLLHADLIFRLVSWRRRRPTSATCCEEHFD